MNNSDLVFFSPGHFNEKASFCLEVNGSCEKFGDDSVHVFVQTNTGGVSSFLFTSYRLGLKTPRLKVTTGIPSHSESFSSL